MIPENLIVRVKQFSLATLVTEKGMTTAFPAIETQVFVQEFVSRPVVRISNEILSINLAATGAKGSIDGIPTLIQDIQPDLRQPYYWIQTNIDGDPNKFAQWFYDGVD